jgi:hypothetical protein
MTRRTRALLATALAVSSIAIGSPLALSAAPSVEQCANIVSGSSGASYAADQLWLTGTNETITWDEPYKSLPKNAIDSSGSILVDLFLEAPSCKSVTYTITMTTYDRAADALLGSPTVTEWSMKGNGSDHLVFSETVGRHNTPCVLLQGRTVDKKGNVWETTPTAPEEQCHGGSGATGSWG